MSIAKTDMVIVKMSGSEVEAEAEALKLGS